MIFVWVLCLFLGLACCYPPGQRLFRPYGKYWPLALWLTLVGVLPARAASVRTYWDFAWDPHSQASLVDYFVLQICISLHCESTTVPGGTTTLVRRVFVNPALNGNGTAVLRACDAKNNCSGDSNTVELDRTPTRCPDRRTTPNRF